MVFKIWYVRHKKTGQHYVGSSYGAAKFSSKEKPSTFFTLASAKQTVKSRILSWEHYYVDQDGPWYKGATVVEADLEIRPCEIVLK